MDGFFNPNPVDRFKREFGDDGNWASLFKGETWNIKPFGIGNPKGGGPEKPDAGRALNAGTAGAGNGANGTAPTAEDAAASQRRRVLNLQPGAGGSSGQLLG